MHTLNRKRKSIWNKILIFFSTLLIYKCVFYSDVRVFRFFNKMKNIVQFIMKPLIQKKYFRSAPFCIFRDKELFFFPECYSIAFALYTFMLLWIFFSASVFYFFFAVWNMIVSHLCDPCNSKYIHLFTFYNNYSVDLHIDIWKNMYWSV